MRLNLKKLSAIRDQEEYIMEVRKYIEEIDVIIQRDNQYAAAGGEAGGMLKVYEKKWSNDLA